MLGTVGEHPGVGRDPFDVVGIGATTGSPVGIDYVGSDPFPKGGKDGLFAGGGGGIVFTTTVRGGIGTRLLFRIV